MIQGFAVQLERLRIGSGTLLEIAALAGIKFDAELAGYLVLTFGYSLEFHGRDALVDELYVREAYRGRGAGTLSLAFVEEICRTEGIRALHLEVDRGNERARRLYHRAGYEDHDRYLLTRWLEP